jgi:enoyl-CoA hydratase/carnithine racemase
MDLKFVKYEKRNHIAYITFNRPERMNAMHPPTSVEMDGVWDDFVADKSSWVAIVTGAGDKGFSAGNDLRWQAENRAQLGEALRAKGGFAGITARFDIYKPIIAAVNGFALGGGFEIALACDIIIAAEHARFGLPEPRVGLMAAAGGVHRLPRHIPLKIAMGMMLTGKHITAADALRFGIANEVVPLKDLIPTAEKWAAEIMECSPLSVQASKEAALNGLGLPVQEALAKHYDLQSKLFRSKDAIEGPLASLVVGAAMAAFPPVGTGAFWIIVAFYGVVSILFDDETPRGVPGIDYFYATRPHLRDPQN